MSIVVGVDAGGTATKVIAADGDVIAGEFSGGPANVRIAGVDDAADTIARAIRSALSGAEPSAVFVGAAGAGRDDLAQTLQRALSIRLPGTAIGVSDDAHIALRASVPQDDGMVLIAGTGSIAYAEAGGQKYRTGGYGYLVGDEGSAFSLGAAALRLTLRSYDGRASRDALIEAVEAQLSTNGAQATLSEIYDSRQPVRHVAELAPLVLQLASEGDRSATKIVQSAALELFDLVRSLVKLANLQNREVPLVFSGGLLAENSLLTYLLETRVGNELPMVHVLKGGPAPQFGALALARDLLAPA
jgi:N-acetylglucosamine kinase-like BadF-type ATPase